jgi:hypothetical protein
MGACTASSPLLLTQSPPSWSLVSPLPRDSWTENEGGFQVWGGSPAVPTDYFWGRTYVAQRTAAGDSVLLTPLKVAIVPPTPPFPRMPAQH